MKKILRRIELVAVDDASELVRHACHERVMLGNPKVTTLVGRLDVMCVQINTNLLHVNFYNKCPPKRQTCI